MLSRPSAESVGKGLLEKVGRNEAGNLSRIGNVVEVLNHQGCKTQHLLAYFGEALGEPCGHCSYCKDGTVVPIAGMDRGLSEAEGERVGRFRSERPIGFVSAREGARFLCGITSPKTSRLRGKKGPLFGALETAPFQAVLAALEA